MLKTNNKGYSDGFPPEMKLESLVVKKQEHTDDVNSNNNYLNFIIYVINVTI